MDSLDPRLYNKVGEKNLERTVGGSGKFLPAPGSSPFPVSSDVAVLAPARTESAVLPRSQYLYQCGGTPVAAKPTGPGAHA